MNTITVGLENRSYSIHVGNGILKKSGKILAELSLSKRIVVVSSEGILSLHGNQLLTSLRRSGFSVDVLGIPSGERYKTLATMEKIYTQLARLRADRKTLLAAFGGGVIGDITGFAAASYLRGIPYAQIPTTLLAQIDSSIGGKTGVNLNAGKNLVGAFHQPSVVIADPLLLLTLPRREFHSGLYEAIKYGVIRNAGLFDLINAKHSQFPQREKSSLEQMIMECASIKAEIISKDEHETGLRMILNYGHTIGHALESSTRYKRLTHGEAIGHGMIMATKLAEQLGKINPEEAQRITQSVQGLSPLPSLNSLRWDRVFRHMLADKKIVDQCLRFILPLRVGLVEIVSDVPKSAVESVVRAYLKACH